MKTHTAKSRSATTTYRNVDELHKLLREKSQIPNGIFIKLQFRTRAKSSGVRSWDSGFSVAWGMIAGDSGCAAHFCFLLSWRAVCQSQSLTVWQKHKDFFWELKENNN